MNAWRATLLIVGKDLRAYFRDRPGLLLGFLLPIALVTVFGFIAKFAFGGTGGTPRIALSVADLDRSQASARFVNALRAVNVLQVRPRTGERAASEETLRGLVRDGEIHHALIIEKGFASSLDALQAPRLTMVRDPDRLLEDRLIRVGVLEAMIGFLGDSLGKEQTVTVRRTLRDAGLSDDQIEQLLNGAQAVQDSLLPAPADNTSHGPDGLSERPTTVPQGSSPPSAPPVDTFGAVLALMPIDNDDFKQAGRIRKYPFHYAQAVSGVTVMMVMFGIMVCSSTLISERDSGTLGRLMVMAIPRSSIFWGKYLFAAAIGLMQLAVFFTYGNVVFRIDAFRDPVTLTVLTLTWTAAANSFGMLIAVWARTTRQAETVSSILILVMAGLGGCWFPTQLMELPPAADIATKFTLTHWAMKGFQGMFWDQLSWMHPKMLTAIAIQWAFVVLASSLALALFRRRYVSG